MALREILRHILIRLSSLGLIIFFALIQTACNPERQHKDFEFILEDGKVVKVRFFNVTDEQNGSSFEIRIAKSNQTQGVLGAWSINDEFVEFSPLVPLSINQNYELIQYGKSIVQFQTPTIDSSPGISIMYPSTNQLPENLLKMYIEFETPMRTGRSLEYITVIQERVDTLEGTFLELNPELWNMDNTILTLWLDPGRIKRGLIPNKMLGQPLKAGQGYQIIISGEWEDIFGNPLGKTFIKEFETYPRDDKLPDVSTWKLIKPKSSGDILRIDFGESLDAITVLESILILKDNLTPVLGEAKLTKFESEYSFKPFEHWESGEYQIKIESRLEDLAGNNLVRPFDREMNIEPDDSAIQGFELTFTLR